MPSNVASEAWVSALAPAILARAALVLGNDQLISGPSRQRSGLAPKMLPSELPVEPIDAPSEMCG